MLIDILKRMKHLKNPTAVGLFIGFALFFTSLLYSHQSISTVIIGNKESQCGVCGEHEIESDMRGFPLAAYIGFADGGTAQFIDNYGPNVKKGWQPLETIGDIVFWIVVAELGVYAFTKLNSKRSR